MKKYELIIETLDFDNFYTPSHYYFSSFDEAKKKLRRLISELHLKLLMESTANTWDEYKKWTEFLEVRKSTFYVYIDEAEAIRYYIEEYEI